MPAVCHPYRNFFAANTRIEILIYTDYKILLLKIQPYTILFDRIEVFRPRVPISGKCIDRVFQAISYRLLRVQRSLFPIYWGKKLYNPEVNFSHNAG